jgi:hypothetical protein
VLARAFLSRKKEEYSKLKFEIEELTEEFEDF